MELPAEIDALAVATHFSGVVRADRDGRTLVAAAYGLADRAHGVPNTIGTRIGVASGAKGFTALMVMRLVELGTLELTTTARSLLGTDLPLIDDRVTIEDLLGHRSGIGDYLDESAGGEITDYVMTVPVHRLETSEDYLQILDGFPQQFAAGTAFAYCNGGYVVLALLAERAAGTPYHDLVRTHVCDRAGLADTAFLRSDELPGDAAVGYLFDDQLRTNVLHLPVRGVGDGGIFTTAADVYTLWQALFAGAIVAPATVAEMVRPRTRRCGGPTGVTAWGSGCTRPPTR